MKLAIDIMGGDHAPHAILDGVHKGLEAFPDVEMHLFGDPAVIPATLSSHDRVVVHATTEVITSDDEPTRAVRRKKDSSMVRAASAVREGEADACLSAGNTGALVASGLLIVGRQKGVERPALAPTLPTLDGNGFVFLDVGANVEAKPQHLYQYALMGHAYAKSVRNVERPRVGLLNVGTEDQKGTALTKETFELLQNESSLHFIGNVEARDLLHGVADVVVTDGFTGNMVLKSIEGTASALFSMLKETFTSSLKAKLAAGVLMKDLRTLKGKMDYKEYGGASLFGLKAPVVKAHGSSDAQAVFHAIRQARLLVGANVSQAIQVAEQKEE